MGWIMPDSVDKAAVDISTFISKFDGLDVDNVSVLLNSFMTSPEQGTSLFEKTVDLPDKIDNVLNSTKEIFSDMKTFGFGGAFTLGIGAIAYATQDHDNKIKALTLAAMSFMVAYMLAPESMIASKTPLLNLVGMCNAGEKEEVAQPQGEMWSLNGIAQAITLALFGATAITCKKGIVDSITNYLNNAKRQQITIIDHMSSAAQFLQGLMNKVLAYFYKEDYKFMNIVKSALPQLDAIQAEIREFCHKMDRKEIPMTSEYYDIVLSYENRLDMLMAEISANKNMEYPRVVITSLQATVKKLLENFASSNFMNAGIRQEPVAVLLKGPPGVGKTAIITRLHMALCARTLPAEELEEFKKNPLSFMHSRQMENEFWDGYTPRAHTALFDDLNQIKDIPGKPDNEFFNLIRAINLFPYLLHMAGIFQKSNTFFKSKFVLCTTNANIFNVESITCKQAILRRFDYCLRVVPLDRYTKNVNGVKVIDPDSLPIVEGEKTLTPECVNLFFCKAEGLGNLSKITFDELVDLMVDKFFAKKAHAEKLLKEYQKVIDENIAKRKPTQVESEMLENQVKMKKELFDPVEVRFEPKVKVEFVPKEPDPIIKEDLIFGETEPQEPVALPEAELPGSFDIHEDDEDNLQYTEEQELIELLDDVQGQVKGSPTPSPPPCRYLNCDPYDTIKHGICDLDMEECEYELEVPKDELKQIQNIFDHYSAQYRVRSKNHSSRDVDTDAFCANNCVSADQHKILTYISGKIVEYGKKVDDVTFEECIKVWRISTGFTLFSNMVDMTFQHFLSKFIDFEFSDGMKELYPSQSYFSRMVNYVKPVMRTKWFNQVTVQLKKLEEGCLWILLKISRFLSNPIVKVAIVTLISYLGLKELFGWICTKGKKKERENPNDGWIVQSRDESAKGKQGAKRNTIKNLLASKAVNMKLVPQMGSTYDKGSQDVIDKVVNRNCYTFSIANHSGKYAHLGFATFLVGRIYMIPMHFATYIADQVINDETAYDRKVRLTKSVNRPGTNFSVIEFTFKEFLEWGIHTPQYEGNDIFFGTISKSYPNHCDIRSKFLKEEQYVAGKDWITSITCPFADRTSTCVVSTYMLRKPYEVASVIPGLPNTPLLRGLCYRKSITTAGHCGALVSNLNKNPSIGTIVGIHIAGIPSLNSGLSNFISREMIMDVTENVGVEYREIEELDPKVAYQEMGKILSFPTDENEINKVPCRFPIIGMIEKPMARPAFSGILKSVLHGRLKTPPRTAPARLCPFMKDDELIDPYELALTKYGLGWKNVPEQLVEQAADVYYEHLLCVSKENVERKVLPYEEAVLGIEDESLYTSIKRNTSAGYPINADPSFVGKKKFGIFGNDEKYDLNTPDALRVKKRVYIIIDSAKENKRLLHIFHDNLKDERREFEKILVGSSRLFSGCPLDYLIVFRMYFGSFFLWFQKNRIYNGSGIGINPFSTEWHLLAEMLKEKGGEGKGYFAGDFKSYDGSLLVVILYGVLQVIQQWYDDGPENAKIRRILWLEVISSKHLWHLIVYAFMDGIPSGHPGTSYINTMYQQIAFRIVWSIILGNASRETMASFTKFVFLVCYGDDNAMGIAPEAREKFSPEAMSQAFSIINLTYTDDKKQVVTELKTFDDISFLKRKFLFNEVDQVYRAPLQLKVILEVPQWTVRKGDQREMVTKNNVQWALEELSLWGRQVYKEFAPDLIQVSLDQLNWVPERSLFESCYSFCCGKDEFF